jgi:hypothetical protein
MVEDIGNSFADEVGAWVECRVDQGVSYDDAWREAAQKFPRRVQLPEDFWLQQVGYDPTQFAA